MPSSLPRLWQVKDVQLRRSTAACIISSFLLEKRQGDLCFRCRGSSSTSIPPASTAPFGQIQPRNCMQSFQNSPVQSHGNPSDIGRVHPPVFTLNIPRVNPSVSKNALSENGFFAIHSELTTLVDRSVHVLDMWHVGTSQSQWNRGRKALQR